MAWRSEMRAAFLLFFGAALAHGQGAPREDQVLIQGNRAGTQTLSAGDPSKVDYSYNDRGRGDHIVATWKLDTSGVLVEYSATGNDYMKAKIEETFRVAD